MKLARRDIFCGALIAVGFLQTLGFVSGVQIVRGLGLATVASPLPLVFTQFRGIETFAARFEMDLKLASGTHVRAEITPTLYAKLDGPYNRRNAYGAVIAYGPGFTEEREKKILHSVLSYGFCSGGPLSDRFGVSERVSQATILVHSRTAGLVQSWPLSVECGI